MKRINIFSTSMLVAVTLVLSLDFAYGQKEAVAEKGATFQPVEISAQYLSKLRAMGTRVSEKGKERVVYAMSATLKEKGQNKAESFEFSYELPGLARLQRVGGRVVGFDGSQAWRKDNALDEDDLALLESLVFDSAEYFFEMTRSGKAIQNLGTRYRLDDGRNPAYVGELYDLILISTPVKNGSGSRFVNKTFYFNSRTKRLEIVRYSGLRSGNRVEVETRFQWRQISADWVLQGVTRTENQEKVIDLQTQGSALSAKNSDGAFKP